MGPNLADWTLYRTKPRRVAVALLCTLSSTALRVTLMPYLGDRVVYVNFFPAIALSAIYGGRFGGLVATALSAVAAAYWIPPAGSFSIANPVDFVALSLFVISGLIVSYACETMQRSQAASETLRQDVSLAEERSREALHLYELLAENRPDIILFIECSTGRIIEANSSALAAYRMTREEMLSSTIFGLQAEASEELVRERIQSADAGGAMFETAHRRMDGSVFPVEVSSRGVTRANQRVLVSIIRDITDRKLAEEALKLSEEKFACTFALNPAAIVISRLPGGEVLDVNGRWAELVGRSREEVIGQRSRDLDMWSDDEERAAVIEDLLRHGSVRDREIRLRKGTGEIIVVLLNAEVLRIADETVVVSTMLDISERKKMEEILRVQANALRAADRSKDEFLAMLAHELRNPLAAILNAATLIGMRADPRSGLSDTADIVTRQGRHLARLVDDLLDVSRITQGRLDLRHERIDLVDCLTRAAETAQPTMLAQNHRFELRSVEGPVWISGDSDRVQQIVGNLLANAAKYTDAGGQITLSLETQGEWAVIGVEDNGHGIPPDLLPRVFGLFVQQDVSLARSMGGLGIGLTVVETLVSLHGGTVEAASDGPGAGSRFTVRLPIALDKAANATATTATAAPTRILLVEDNEDSAQTLREILLLDGHEVRVACDGHAALEALEAFSPDVALLDIGLPGIDGYEVACRLRASAQWSGLPLIALTGYAREEDRRRTREAGFNDHLAKPVDVAELRTALARVTAEPAPAP